MQGSLEPKIELCAGEKKLSPLKILLPSHETLSIVFALHTPDMKKRKKEKCPHLRSTTPP